MAARFALNAKEYSLNQRRQQVFNLSCSLFPSLQISLFYKSIIGLLTPPSSHVGKEERNSRAISLASIHPTLNLAAKLFESFVLVLPLRLSLSLYVVAFFSPSVRCKSLLAVLCCLKFPSQTPVFTFIFSEQKSLHQRVSLVFESD